MNLLILSLWSIFFCIFINCVTTYNILGLFPFPSRSHVIVFDSLMVELTKRGHRVTVYSPFTGDRSSVPNYERVALDECFKTNPTFTSVSQSGYNKYVETFLLLFVVSPKAEEILGCEPLLKLRDSMHPYDLLITETFLNDFFQLFGPWLNIPVITFHSTIPFPWMTERTGLPGNPSYLRGPLVWQSDLNFRGRIENTLIYLESTIMYCWANSYIYDVIAEKFFGPGLPTVDEVSINASLMFTYTHYTYNQPRPVVPNVVEVAGLHIKPPKTLPKDIEKFINESTHGVIYFCMGSLLRGETFPVEKRDAFLYAFSKIPQRVLWKWEGELPGKLDNIMTAKWMPQRDILAHPNVKLFISHGGLLGTTEAVYEGVPVLGIPIFGDQKTNIRALESNGAGEILEYESISKDVVLEKIQRLINDHSYSKQAKELSIRYKDRPMSPMDTAVYWTEYVIRHRGAPHLKTAAVNMPWYQYLLLDVIAFFLLVLIAIYYVIKLSFRFICNLLCSKASSVSESKKKKKRN